MLMTRSLAPTRAPQIAQAFRELQAENQRLKEAIEQAWDNAGLPTFLRYLREYIQGQSRDVADGRWLVPRYGGTDRSRTRPARSADRVIAGDASTHA